MVVATLAPRAGCDVIILVHDPSGEELIQINPTPRARHIWRGETIGATDESVRLLSSLCGGRLGLRGPFQRQLAANRHLALLSLEAFGDAPSARLHLWAQAGDIAGARALDFLAWALGIGG